MLKTLLLNASGECISFINEEKVCKFLSKPNKVEVISNWNEKIFYGRGWFYHPSILRLKHQVRWIPKRIRYSSIAVFKRDQFKCQYCGIFLTAAKSTIDHVVPRYLGGTSGWKNCVTACFECNNRKGPRTPEQAGMPLLKVPKIPTITVLNEISLLSKIHPDWEFYIQGLK